MSQLVSQQIESQFRESFGSSAALYERAVGLFPSGVTHDSRFLRPFPIYVDHAQGARKTDRDGNDLIDYWMGHGALCAAQLGASGGDVGRRRPCSRGHAVLLQGRQARTQVEDRSNAGSHGPA